jgi:excisionase family DNA binding protein
MGRSCYDRAVAQVLMTVEEARRALGVSRSTVWRRIQRGELHSVRRGGRRLIRAASVRTRTAAGLKASVPAFSDDHPMFRLIGAGRSGGAAPGARDKHAILDE